MALGRAEPEETPTGCFAWYVQITPLRTTWSWCCKVDPTARTISSKSRPRTFRSFRSVLCAGRLHACAAICYKSRPRKLHFRPWETWVKNPEPESVSPFPGPFSLPRLATICCTEYLRALASCTSTGNQVKSTFIHNLIPSPLL